jgi:FAD/FMN-containing dehydrogenase/Fe-S oxidoreductase
MIDLSPGHRRELAAIGCTVRFDDLTRQLYATDASIYQVVPAAVAFPRSAAEVAALLGTAAAIGLPVTPRGAASGLTGGALGEGLVLDMARYGRRILELDPEERRVRVEPGVVLDQLNQAAAPHGLWFGPDVATSSRATLGGMIANGSSGARAPVYGTTTEHVLALDIVLADGRVARVGQSGTGLDGLAGAADRIVARVAGAVTERLPGDLVKRWPGYGLDRALAAPGDLSKLICGSEGTLAVVCSAELQLSPLPAERGLAVLFFGSVIEAMQAAVELLELEPAAVEHVDRPLFDQTRSLPAFARARALLELDERPCEAILLVELFGEVRDDVDARLDQLTRRSLGLRSLVCRTAEERELVWSVRKAGLNLVTSRPGPAKTAPGIEDVCVRPHQLPDYVRGLQEILEPLGIATSFYGHAASGLLHVRPRVDMHTEHGVVTLRRVADQVAELCRRFRGSLASEHGLGIARTEYLAGQIGDELMAATVELKRLLDPGGLLNPGKVVDTGRFKIDRDLRWGAGYALELPFEPQLGFIDRDHSFIGNLEQCNGCGGCLKDEPTMCPTHLAVGEEVLSTRGRANAIRAALDGRLDPDRVGIDGLLAGGEGLVEALGSCLSCKACKRECPSGVDMALLKAELLNARHRRYGVPTRDRIIAAADTVGRLGSALAPLANPVLRWPPTRRIVAAALGFDPTRRIPEFASERFDHWLEHRLAGADHAAGGSADHSTSAGPRMRVLLWDDTWVRYHEPGVGRAAVEVLTAAGVEVEPLPGRLCCGRPASSRGLLDEVRRLGSHNLALLARRTEPIVFLEPSCYSMLIDEYRQLGLEGADEVAARCRLLEDLLLEVLERWPEALPRIGEGRRVAVHVHCHAKALADPGSTVRLLERLGFDEARQLETGCCGMAGAFGMERAHAELSREVARPLVEMIDELDPGTVVVASGMSCRHQTAELAGRAPVHLAELLAGALEGVTGAAGSPAGASRTLS